MIEIVEAGLFTTLQDTGRPGLSHLGISRGGAADPVSHALSNRLVGNHPGEVTLEMTLKGAKLRFHSEAVFALSGSDFGATLDGKSLAPWRTHHAPEGAILSCSSTREGARAYLAVRGGLDVPVVLGSRSSWNGPIRSGEKLATAHRTYAAPCEASSFRIPFAPVNEILILPGLELGEMDEASRLALTGTEWTVSEQSNRAGLRLQGTALKRSRERDCLTEGVCRGAVQLPSGGQPIVLMGDQETTGGYPRIAQVCLRDLYRLGQLKPRDRARFRLIDFDTALVLLQEIEKQITESLQ